LNKKLFLEKIKELLEINEELTDEFELNHYNWDSLALIGAISVIDEIFGKTIPANDLEKCTSIGELWELVQGRS